MGQENWGDFAMLGLFHTRFDDEICECQPFSSSKKLQNFSCNWSKISKISNSLAILEKKSKWLFRRFPASIIFARSSEKSLNHLKIVRFILVPRREFTAKYTRFGLKQETNTRERKYFTTCVVGAAGEGKVEWNRLRLAQKRERKVMTFF